MTMLFMYLLISLNSQDPFEQVEKLVKEQQYSDAFSLLNDLDPDNEDPEVFRRKIDICIDYYVMSIGHQLFALKNLEEGEDIQSLRGKEGSYDMYSLEVSKIASGLMENYPNDYKLKFAVGRYYHSMHLNCGNCSLSAADCISEFEALFEECYEHDVYDYFSAYGIAYAKVNKQQYEESIQYFLKSIDLNDQYPSSHYNLSYAYLFLNDRENAIKYAKNAFERYEYQAHKADAAKIAGTAYNEMDEYEKAYEQFAKANELFPNDYYTLKPLLELCVYLKRDREQEVREVFFELDSDNPTIYQDMISMYYDFGDINDLMAFFKSKLPTYSEDYATQGSLYFFIGKIDLEAGKLAEAKKSLTTAKSTLTIVFEEDHQVFAVIDELLNQSE